ncbi:MAG: prolyl oligopeptidase family serine peptidase [Phycisphaera sp.]|nr:prolyl oligopeptidase family serine peptidase [Phycisphaera sp.]
MNIMFVSLAACALCAGGVLSAQEAEAPRAAPVDRFAAIASLETTVRKADGAVDAVYRSRLVEPSTEALAKAGGRLPLVVFLHGSGERGDDNTAQLKHFAGATAGEEFQSRVPAFVLAMQCPRDESWSAIDLKAFREKGELPRFAEEPTRAMRALVAAIEEVLATKPVDRDRVYLTGLSMGGFGAFDLAARRPELFAAIAPICGGGDPTTAARFAHLPLAIVHGADDPVVPVALSRAMRDAAVAAGGSPRFLELAGIGHDAWTPAYRFGTDGILDWMFAQRRN